MIFFVISLMTLSFYRSNFNHSCLTVSHEQRHQEFYSAVLALRYNDLVKSSQVTCTIDETVRILKMRFKFIILWFFVTTSTIQGKKTENDERETTTTAQQNEFKSRINAWWTKMSTMKPIKCQMNNPTPEDIDVNVNPFVKSWMCDTDKFPTHLFSFRGNVDDQGRFQGPVKIRFNVKYKNVTNDRVCISIGKIGNDPISSIVGNFINGTLQGDAKIFVDAGTKNLNQ